MSDIFNLNVNKLTVAGNVGIGTSTVSNPNSYGSVLNVAGYAPAIVLSEDTGRDYTIGVNGNKFSIFDETDAVLTIDDSGRVGIGTSSPNAAAILDVQSTTKGIRFPNMTTTQNNAMANVAGMQVFDTTLSKMCFNTGSAWETITSA